jgi:hypothetical protein
MKLSAALLTTTLLLSLINTRAQDHGHLNIGASGTNQNDALLFDESDIFDTASGYVNTLTYTNSGRFAGRYVGNLTTTALAATPGHPAYASNAAAFGSQIFAELASVEGPAGGTFSFWESGATSPTVSLSAGSTGTNAWIISENNGSAGSDPYGHIHARRFTATVPGIYIVGLRALDRSMNGVGGGPIHSPSAVLKIYFQAGVQVKGVNIISNQARVTYSAPAGATWVLEASTNLSPSAVWTPVGTPLPGDDHFHEVIDTEPVAGARFYRSRRQ